MLIMKLVILVIFFLYHQIYCFDNIETYNVEGPSLIRFDLDMNYGALDLYFDQLVQANSFNLSRAYLQSESQITLNTIIFQFLSTPYNLLEQGNTTTINLFLHSDDYAKLILTSNIAKSYQNTFLTLLPNSIKSIYNNPSNNTILLQVTNYKIDISPPYVIKFIFSMNTGDLTIDFSEPIDPTTFTLDGLAFQSQKNSLYNDKYVILNNYTNIISILNYQRRLVCNIGINNLNSIKKITDLSTTKDNTFLSAIKPFIKDISGNNITINSFQRIFGLQVSTFIPDTNNPTLLSWDLDLHNGYIILYFSETILMQLFNYTGITICNSNTLKNSTLIMRISDPIIESYENTPNVIIKLNLNQLNILRYPLNFGINSTNTFLILDSYLAVDTSLNQNRYQGLDATENNARPVNKIIKDDVSPKLLSTTFDLTQKIITLIFTTVIDISTINLNEINLQSSKFITSKTEVFRFIHNEYIILPSSINNNSHNHNHDSDNYYDDRVSISIKSSFSILKSFLYLGRSINTTFIAFTHRFVRDKHYNYAIEIPTNHAKMVDNFISDISKPLFLSWSINMNIGEIILTFTEPIDLETFNISAISLQSSSILSPSTISQSLTSTSNITRNYNNITILLSTKDINSIKQHYYLCQDLYSCYIYFTSYVGYDVGTKLYNNSNNDNNDNNNNNNIVFIDENESNNHQSNQNNNQNNNIIIKNEVQLIENGLLPLIFIEDITSPILLSYNIDLNLGNILLYFSEPIYINSIDPTGMVFYDGTNFNEFLRLSEYTIHETTSFCMETILLTLTRQDFYLLKSQNIFNLQHKLWLTLSNDTFIDYKGNYINGEKSGINTNKVILKNNNNNGLPTLITPSKYINDITGPSIIGLQIFGFNSIIIYLDDVININTINKGKLILSSFESIKILPLTNSIITNNNNLIDSKIYLSISNIADQIRKLTPLLTNQQNSYIYISDNFAIYDTSLNSNKKNNPLILQNIGGVLLYFTLDMNLGILTFETIYPIDFTLSSITSSNFQLINKKTKQSYYFTNFISLTKSLNGYFFKLQMSNLDYENIQQSGIVTYSYNLKLKVLSSAIIDTSNLKLNSTITLNCLQLNSDITPLIINYYTINMATGYLDIFFNKPISYQSINLNKLTLVNSRINSNYNINLGNASIIYLTTTASNWIRINLNSNSYHPSLRDLIHLTKTITLSISNTYLVIDEGFIHDTAIPPNYLNKIIQDYAIQPSIITSDKNSPYLLNYNIDFNKRLLILNFNEAVNYNNIKINKLKLLSSPNQISTNVYWLSLYTKVSDETLNQTATSTIILSLSSYDIDNIMLMYPNLCTSKLNTYLSYPSGIIQDIAISSNSIQQIFDIYAIQVNTFIKDTTSPNIIQYNISIETQLLTFHFNEMINCSLTNINKISFQSTKFIGKLSERFTLRSLYSNLINCNIKSPITRFITIQIGREDILIIKTFKKLLKSLSSTYLYLQSGAFIDVIGNLNLPIIDGYTKIVDYYWGDITPPKLLSFYITNDLNLNLFFNEPININTLDITKIIFHDYRIPKQSYQLTKSSTLSYYDLTFRKVIIYLHTDYDFIYSSTNIFTSQNTSYLSTLLNFVKDTSNNNILQIYTNSSLNMGPSIMYWELDMNLNKLTLYFTNKVNSQFTPKNLIIQNHLNNPTIQITLSTNTKMILINNNNEDNNNNIFYENNTIYSIILNNNDLTNLKLSNILINSNNLYLYSSIGLTKSLIQGTVVYPLNSTETFFPLLISKFILDSTGPNLLSTVLNLNIGIFSLYFDEPINGHSIDTSKITLRTISGSSITLINNYDNYQNSSIIHINLTIDNLNEIKLINSKVLITEVIFETNFLTDLFDNYPFNNNIYTTQITTIINDITPPKLLKCNLNLNTNEFYLFYDEIINTSSIITNQIYLHSNNFINPLTYNFTLSNYSIIEQSSIKQNNITINMNLFKNDAFKLQQHPIIGKSSSTTYIFIPNVKDLNNNIDISTSLTQCIIENDINSPSLESFDYNLIGNTHPTTITLTLYFSEVILLSSFNCRDFILLSESSLTPLEIFQPPTSSSLDCNLITTTNSREIIYELYLTSSFTLIGLSIDSTYISIISTNTITDISGNKLNSISYQNALRVGPKINNYFLDITNNKMILIFSKPINILSTKYNISNLGFYSSISQKLYYLSSSSDLVIKSYFNQINNYDFVIIIELTLHNIIHIKLLQVSQFNLFLISNDQLFFDSYDISTLPITITNNLTPIRFISDYDPPIILNSSIDMSLNLIKLTLNEPIIESSFKWNLFILQSLPGNILISSSSSSIEYYKLTTGNLIQSIEDSVVILYLYLNSNDSGSIKLLTNLASNITNSYYSIGYNIIEDLSGNTLIPINSLNAKQFIQYIPDTLSPILIKFSLNMNIGKLILTFSEPINSYSVNPLDITLQSRYSRGSSNLLYKSLTTDSYAIKINNFTITINLGENDIISIKNTSNLARKASSTYLTALSSMAKDLAGNEMIEIIDGQALPVTTFISDTTSPIILGISLDLSTNILKFYISELVIISSINITAVTIHDPITEDYYTFTNYSNVILTVEQFSSIIIFSLATNDLNSLKSRYPLGINEQHTYISVESSFCTDVYKNSVNSIPFNLPMKISQYNTDTIVPKLLSYTIDMNSEVIILQYSETILYSSILLEQVILQNREVKRYGNFINLSLSTFYLESDSRSNILIIYLDSITINYMKWNGIGISNEFSFLSWGSNFLSDVFLNYLLPLWDGSVSGYHPILPNDYFKDTISPIIVKWFYDRQSTSINIIFSEPVNLLNCSSIYILSESMNITILQCNPHYFNYGTKIRLYLNETNFTSISSENIFNKVLNEESIINKLNEIKFGELFLKVMNATVSDLVVERNFIEQSNLIIESSPDCSSCPEGTFVLSTCTSLDDRVCQTCKKCGVREWIFEECSEERDTSCMSCADCPIGTYISTSCTSKSDTVCSKCTKCGKLEYQSRECVNGLDSLCDSCKYCSFANSAVATLCHSDDYFWWHHHNCCYDKDGKEIPCKVSEEILSKNRMNNDK